MFKATARWRKTNSPPGFLSCLLYDEI